MDRGSWGWRPLEAKRYTCPVRLEMLKAPGIGEAIDVGKVEVLKARDLVDFFFGPRNLKKLKQTFQDFPYQDGRPAEELCFDIQAL